MSVAAYEVVSKGGGWAIKEQGGTKGDYATKEAAFEAIVIAASNAIKSGDEVQISVPGRQAGGKPSLGAR
ncbi:MAG TPA: DUF2188 domain-containing protein [Pseudolabrys sp.]|nr:DUF2188 domain-containing protein [Pseudolabrys sp.]